MSIRKQGLVKVVAGLAILFAFLQASALQSLMGEPSGLSYLLSQVGPFICLTAALVGCYELVSGSSLRSLWQRFQRLRPAHRLGVTGLAVLTLVLLVHLIFHRWGNFA